MNVKIDYDKMVKPKLETRTLKTEQEALTFKEYSIIQTHTVADLFVDNVSVVDEHRNAYIYLQPIYDRLDEHEQQIKTIQHEIDVIKENIKSSISSINNHLDTIDNQIQDIYSKIGG